MDSSAKGSNHNNNAHEPAKPANNPAGQTEYDRSEDVDFWEAQETTSGSGARISDSSTVKDAVEGHSDDDLALESHAQTGGDRSVQKVQSKGKSVSDAKNPTGTPSPKRANTETNSNYGAAERRSGGEDSQGITAHKESAEDARQAKVVSIRNDAKAAGRRTGSKNKAS